MNISITSITMVQSWVMGPSDSSLKLGGCSAIKGTRQNLMDTEKKILYCFIHYILPMPLLILYTDRALRIMRSK
jgi:hypothetical protein